MSGNQYVGSVACALRALGAAVLVSGALLTSASAQAPAPPDNVVWPDPPPPAGPDAIFEGEGGPTAVAKPAAPASAPSRRPAASAGVSNIRCDGVFGKDTSQAKLAATFGAKNVVFQPVDGPEGTKMNATVVFPSDPKRRIEVLWHDETGRKKPATIVVGSQSTWHARGFRIGEGLAAVEKVNGKPFKLSGLDWTYGGAARDWLGGKLENLSGGCRLGMRFEADPNAPQAARASISGDREFMSDNADMRAVTPKIVELVIGYPGSGTAAQ